MNKLVDHIKDLIDEKEIKGIKPHIIYLGTGQLMSLYLDKEAQKYWSFISASEKEVFGLKMIEVNLDDYLKVY